MGAGFSADGDNEDVTRLFFDLLAAEEVRLCQAVSTSTNNERADDISGAVPCY